MADMQEVKSYLSRLLNIDNDIGSKLSVVEKMRRTTMTIKATQFKQDNVQEAHQYTQEDRVSEYLDMEREVDDMVDELVKLKVKVLKEINRLDDRLHIVVLTERYVNSEGWKCIADKLGYKSTRNVYNLHGSALQEFYERNKKEVDKYSKTVQ